ncbi:amidoligase family protein [Pontibacter roseus]|uniref:amidoligase family protein n=1 Tax=Pontibacter roseus TaxID=336989 RepID=UPI000367A3BA|nr:amidoligase family protein [Pontibacter roseus]
MAFKLPPVLHNEAGSLRRVGFELEYSNVGIEESARLIQELYGGEVQQESRFKLQVKDTELGDFTVEFDLTLLTEKSYKKAFEAFNIHVEEVKLGESTLEAEVEEALERIIGKIFPYEVACPPIPCTQLEQLEKLREALYRQHAQGTESFPTNAFGTHINVETPSKDTDTLLAYLRAFLLLYPWLLRVGDTDLARRLSPFIAPYPAAYTALVLQTGYSPDLERFIQDYHTHNPDRNRPLDMYPLFAALDQEALSPYTNLGKVKARDTFHYRLPNSSIALPDWTLAKEWNNWVAVEELAHDRPTLEQMCQEYLYLKKDSFLGFETKWIDRINTWVS